jgi:hypothetical protein
MLRPIVVNEIDLHMEIPHILLHPAVLITIDNTYFCNDRNTINIICMKIPLS